jgi:hypothetical protein
MSSARLTVPPTGPHRCASCQRRSRPATARARFEIDPWSISDMAQTFAGPPPGRYLQQVFRNCRKIVSFLPRRHHSAGPRHRAARFTPSIRSVAVARRQNGGLSASHLNTRFASLGVSDFGLKRRPRTTGGLHTKWDVCENRSARPGRAAARLTPRSESFPHRTRGRPARRTPEDRRQRGGKLRFGQPEIPLGPRQEPGRGRDGSSRRETRRSAVKRLRRRLSTVKPSPSAATRRPVCVPASAMDGTAEIARLVDPVGQEPVAVGPGLPEVLRPDRIAGRVDRAERIGIAIGPGMADVGMRAQDRRRSPAGHGDAPRRGTGFRSPAPAARGPARISRLARSAATRPSRG